MVTVNRADKRFKSFMVKAAEPNAEPSGEVEAAFSVFDELDWDGDIVRKGAFKDGQAVPMVWHHQWPQIVGKGVVAVQTDRAVFKGHFFMDTVAGADAFKTVRNMGDLQDWSFGYKVTKTSITEVDGKSARVIEGLELFEVSPVLLGANDKTATLSIKSTNGEKLSDQLTSLLAEMKAVTDRVRSVTQMRSRDNRGLGRETQDRVREVQKEIGEIGVALDAILIEPMTSDALQSLRAKAILTLSKINGALPQG